MAAIHGKRGSGAFTSLVFEMISFTVDAVCDVAESSVMSSVSVTSATHWKDYVAGMKDWSATVECLEPAAGGGLIALGTEAALTLDPVDGSALSGSAICTGFGPSVGIDAAAALTLTFQGTGALTAA